MTQKQLSETKKALPPYGKSTNEEKIIHKELDIRDYMISCLCYDYDYYNTLSYCLATYHQKMSDVDAKELKELGVENPEQRIKEIWDKMKSDFEKHAVITKGTYTDCEGLSYNSITWRD